MLATITFAHHSSAAIIGDAMRSVVDWADMCVVVDRGTTEEMFNEIRSIVGDKLRVVADPGDLDRNYGMDQAEALGATWACTLDPDERMHCEGVNVKEELEKIGYGTVLVPHINGHYSKERFFRLPLVDRFVHGPHECVPPVNQRQVYMTGVAFDELIKSPEEIKRKSEGILPGLVKLAQDEPGCPRWWYYLGDTLSILERYEEALTAFQKCADLRGWDEESAFSCFRAACILMHYGRNTEAMDTCCAGLSRHPGLAELAWLAGEIALATGWPDKAVYWARIALANSIENGEAHFVKPRIGFRHHHGITVGPYDLMAKAYKALGMTAEQDAAQSLMDRYRKKEVDHA